MILMLKLWITSNGVGQMCFPWWKITCSNLMNLLWCPRAPWHAAWELQIYNNINSCFLSGYGWLKKKKDFSEPFPNKHLLLFTVRKTIKMIYIFLEIFFPFGLSTKHLSLTILEAENSKISAQLVRYLVCTWLSLLIVKSFLS